MFTSSAIAAPHAPGLQTKSAEAHEFSSLFAALAAVREELVRAQKVLASDVDGHPGDKSVLNLVHYLALRHRDVRTLQERLARVGLSSLGRSEAHVLASVDAVLRTLAILSHDGGRERVTGIAIRTAGPSFDEGNRLLAAHAEALLGPGRKDRPVRIMVTLPSEAATDYTLVRDMIARGMDVARINCAHDDRAAWARMAMHVKRARRELGVECRIALDLPGPKLRTGPIAPGPRVIKWKPKRDRRGRVLVPARVWLRPPGFGDAPADIDVEVPVSACWLERLRRGDRIQCVDLRGKTRTLEVTETGGAGIRAEASQTAYVGPGTRFTIAGHRVRPRALRETTLGDGIAALAGEIVVRPEDTLRLTRRLSGGAPAELDPAGHVIAPAHVGCTLAEAFESVRVGHRVFIDDGKIGAVVTAKSRDSLRLRITRANSSGSRVLSDKGINLPDTDLNVAFPTERDRELLPFAARHADIIGISFVQTPADVHALQRELRRLHAPSAGVVLKIETRRAFEQIPKLLLSAMDRRPLGVMIARGDLAIECGYERMAEIQEEMLWICEAAHVPVIWATAVLERLAKTGQPSRAEMTDAAMSERAECVMLNKGPHILEAIRVLDDVLRRMQKHQRKKTPAFRPLDISNSLF